MKKLIVVIASILLIVTANGQQTMNFRGLNINITALQSEIRQPLCDSLIDYTLAEGKASAIVKGFSKRYSEGYLMDILSGNLSGKDTNVLRVVYLLYSSDMLAKTELVTKLLYLKNKELDLTPCVGDTVIGFYDNSHTVTGQVIAINKATELAIIEYNGNLYKCNIYAIKQE